MFYLYFFSKYREQQIKLIFSSQYWVEFPITLKSVWRFRTVFQNFPSWDSLPYVVTNHIYLSLSRDSNHALLIFILSQNYMYSRNHGGSGCQFQSTFGKSIDSMFLKPTKVSTVHRPRLTLNPFSDSSNFNSHGSILGIILSASVIASRDLSWSCFLRLPGLVKCVYI